MVYIGMAGGEKGELRRQAIDTWRKEKQDVKISAEIDLSCCNFASWWFPPSAINLVYIIMYAIFTIRPMF
jgi:hypothetical protein